MAELPALARLPVIVTGHPFGSVVAPVPLVGVRCRLPHRCHSPLFLPSTQLLLVLLQAQHPQSVPPLAERDLLQFHPRPVALQARRHAVRGHLASPLYRPACNRASQSIPVPSARGFPALLAQAATLRGMAVGHTPEYLTVRTQPAHCSWCSGLAGQMSVAHTSACFLPRSVGWAVGMTVVIGPALGRASGAVLVLGEERATLPGCRLLERSRVPHRWKSARAGPLEHETVHFTSNTPIHQQRSGQLDSAEHRSATEHDTENGRAHC